MLPSKPIFIVHIPRLKVALKTYENVDLPSKSMGNVSMAAQISVSMAAQISFPSWLKCPRLQKQFFLECLVYKGSLSLWHKVDKLW
jgi:hypothetical protein